MSWERIRSRVAELAKNASSWIGVFRSISWAVGVFVAVGIALIAFSDAVLGTGKIASAQQIAVSFLLSISLMAAMLMWMIRLYRRNRSTLFQALRGTVEQDALVSKSMNQLRARIRAKQKQLSRGAKLISVRDNPGELGKVAEQVNAFQQNYIHELFDLLEQAIPDVLLRLKNKTEAILSIFGCSNSRIKVLFITTDSENSKRVSEATIAKIIPDTLSAQTLDDPTLIGKKVSEFKPLLRAAQDTTNGHFYCTNNSDDLTEDNFPETVIAKNSVVIVKAATHTSHSEVKVDGFLCIFVENPKNHEVLLTESQERDLLLRSSNAVMYQIDSVYSSIYVGFNRFVNEQLEEIRISIEHFEKQLERQNNSENDDGPETYLGRRNR